ncbi:class B sortase [Paenibacillus konkukensis]|nr:class B sortase [Paenibacillus konkukensis]
MQDEGRIGLRRRVKDRSLQALTFLSAAALVYGIVELAAAGNGYHHARQVMAEARQVYAENSAVEKAPSSEAPPRFQGLLAWNPDVAGWLKIDDTFIDYPIVRGRDNEFYLSHNLKREPEKAGSIFMDYRNGAPGERRNTILYGHRMKDGSMFGQLKEYLQREFLEEHRTFSYETLTDRYEAEVFSVYYTKTEFNYIQTSFESDEQYERFLQEIRSRSLYRTDTEVTAEDMIITLSTCDYTLDPEEGRLAVHAKLVRSQNGLRNDPR